MEDTNKFQLIGRIDRIMEKTTKKGQPYTTFTVAVVGFKEFTNWFYVTMWAALPSEIKEDNMVVVMGKIGTMQKEVDGKKITNITLNAFTVENLKEETPY
jgi:hypothetical protein